MRGQRVDDLKADFGIGNLFVAPACNAKQLLVPHFLAAKRRDIPGNQIIGALNTLALLEERRFLPAFRQIIAVHHVKAAALLQACEQDGARLIAQTVNPV